MKIGEFAKAVGTRISVLRHYDREGLLRPVFTGKFTGWEKHSSNLTIADYRKKMVKHFYTLIKIL